VDVPQRSNHWSRIPPCEPRRFVIGEETLSSTSVFNFCHTKATVSAWRVSLEDRRLGSSSIIIRMSAIRKLANTSARRSSGSSSNRMPRQLAFLA
jgi:hypothetical protein